MSLDNALMSYFKEGWSRGKSFLAMFRAIFLRPREPRHTQLARELAACFLMAALFLQTVPAPAAYANAKITKPKAARAASPENFFEPAAQGEAVTVYGPRRVDRVTPQTRFTESFAVPVDVVGPFTLQLQNGELDGSNRVLAGTLRLNGATVISPGELTLSTPALSQMLTLNAINEIEVSFTGRAKSFLSILITGQRLSGALPNITSFTPSSGPVGTQVNISGNNLTATTGTTTVTFAGSNNTRRDAQVLSATATQVSAVVPNGAVTGVIGVATSAGSTLSLSPFTVNASQDFQVIAMPTTANVVQGGSTTVVVSVSSVASGFSQLVNLSVSGLPGGVTATFDPQQISAGSTSNLNINLAQSGLAAGSYPFTLTGTANIDGSDLTRAASAALSVASAGQTTLSGRVLSINNEPVVGATASLDGHSATTDAAGNFLLTGINAGTSRPVQIDGRTASAPGRSYPVITEPATVVANEANVVPFIFFLPPVDTQFEREVPPGQTTVVGNPRVDNLAMTVPANVQLVNRDGTPVTRVSITPVDIDRTPAPLPAGVAPVMVFTSQPGGARPMPGSGGVVPVVYPNLTGANPGTQIPLYAFDHDTVQWYIYGNGTVSADGRTIVPNAGVGLRDFSWHFPNPSPPEDPGCTGQGNGEGDEGADDGSGLSCENDGGAGGCVSSNPVDLSTGLKLENDLDLLFKGERGGISLRRLYNTRKVSGCTTCPFGRGATHNYDARVTGSFTVGGAGRVIMPSETTGQLFSYERTDTDGALVFTTTGRSNQLGVVLRKLSNGTFEYRHKQGPTLKFNTSGRLVAKIDRNGNSMSFTYTGSNLTRITDGVGRSVNLEYTGSSITRVTDPLGRVMNYAYDSSNRLATVIDARGDATRYNYDDLNRITSIVDGRGNTKKQIAYDANGRVSQQKMADDGTLRYNYTLAGQLVTGVTMTDAVGRTMQKRFDGRGYVTEYTDGLGQRSVIQRDMNTHLPVQTTGPCGCAEVTRAFDERGNLLSQTDRLGQTTRYAYDPVFNKITRKTDRLGRVTTYVYDARGNMVSMTDPLSQTWTYVYDANGQPTSMTDPLNHTMRMEYDAQGNMTARVDALNHRTTMEYDAVGHLTAIVDPLGRRTLMTYDPVDRIASMTDASGATTTYTYDANGNQTSLTNANNQTWTRIYDVKNNLLSSVDPLGRTTRYLYDAEDQLTKVITPSGRTMRYVYDARGQRTSMTDGEGGIVRFTYDFQRNLTTLTDQRGNATTFTYDELYRVKTVRDPLGQLTTMSYDAVGNVTDRVDRLGRHILATYDGLNRPTRAQYADATVDYLYDTANRRTRLDDTQGGSIQWAYDDANRLLSETTPAGVVRYTYNDADQLATMTAADRPPVNYAYDSAGRLQTIAQATETFTYAYDTLSRMTAMQRPNNVTTTYDYNGVNRLTRLTHRNAANQALEDLRYTYNPDDEIETINSLASGVLLPAPKTVAPANAANRIPNFGDAAYAFDTEGQTTTQTTPQGVTSYTWDARGRLTQALTPNGQTVSYTYDALGRRTSRTSGAATTTFLYDGHDVVIDRNSNGSATDYLNGLGLDDKLRQADASGSLYFLQDHLHSTLALANTSGAVVEAQQYEAFGANAGSALSRYGFTGRERDQATGLIYYRARWYDTTQGRFVTEDPLAYAGIDNNFYSYANNDPIRRTDPFGLYAGIDDLLFSTGGALSGIIGQAISDAIAGNVSGLDDYLIAGTSGAVAGEVSLYLGPVAGAAAGNLVEQGLNIATCKQEGFQPLDFFVGTALGKAPDLPLNGITKGRGSWAAVRKQVITKLRNGQIRNVSPKTAGKIVGSRVLGDSIGNGASGIWDGIKRSWFPDRDCACPK
jgi:RHS repeat-associated protein